MTPSPAAASLKALSAPLSGSPAKRASTISRACGGNCNSPPNRNFSIGGFTMRQTFLLILLVSGIPAATLGQAPASDAQTLQALLTEVRELRRDLRASLARIQVVQILLSRLQTQQAVVTRASDRLNDARSRLAGAQKHQKDVRAK